MDEFVRGNFSRAGEIVDQYQKLLQKCVQETTNKYLSWKTMKEHLDWGLNELLIEKEKIESELKEVLDKIDEIEKLAKELKKEKKKNNKREAIWKKFKEMKWDTNEFEDFLDAVKKANPDNYKQWEEEINEFLNSTNYQRIKKRHQENNMRNLKSKRNEMVRKLNHKGNSWNIEKQIEDIQKWRSKRQLEKNIEDDVKKYFWKKDEFHNREEDQRSMMVLYIEIMNSRIILNRNIEEKLRREFIRKFQDKFWLWEYVWDIYQDLMIKNMEMKDSLKIDWDIYNEDKIKNKLIEEIGYWIDFCINNYNMWLEKLEEDDIKYLEDKLNEEKKHGRDMTKLNDDRLKKIFRILNGYLEDVELENKFEMIWNYLYQWISLDTKNIRDILKKLFKYINEEDKKYIIERYGDWNAFKEMEEEIVVTDNQLSLFD